MGNTTLSSSSSSSSGQRTRSASLNVKHVHQQNTEIQILSSYQKIILRAAWRCFSTRSSQVSCGKIVLRRLALKDPEIKTVFQHFYVLRNVFQSAEDRTANSKEYLASQPWQEARQCSFDNHAIQFAQFLQFLMSNLDDPNSIARKCEEIGRLHRKVKVFGMKTDHWDLFGEAITETVREYQGWRRHRQAVAATNLLISFVVDRIRSGFLQRTECLPWVKTPHTTIEKDSVPPTRGNSTRRSDKSRVISTSNHDVETISTKELIKKAWQVIIARVIVEIRTAKTEERLPFHNR